MPSALRDATSEVAMVLFHLNLTAPTRICDRLTHNLLNTMKV